MKRYEIRCRNCNKTLGYVTLPYTYDDIDDIVSASAVNGIADPILCPACEVKSLMELEGIWRMKNE